MLKRSASILLGCPAGYVAWSELKLQIILFIGLRFLVDCITKSDLTRPIDIFRMAEFYCPEIAILKSALFAPCVDKKNLRNFSAASDILNDNEKLKR